MVVPSQNYFDLPGRKHNVQVRCFFFQGPNMNKYQRACTLLVKAQVCKEADAKECPKAFVKIYPKCISGSDQHTSCPGLCGLGYAQSLARASFEYNQKQCLHGCGLGTVGVGCSPSQL